MRKSLLIFLVLASFGARAQSPGTPTAGPGNTAGLLWASNFGLWSVPQGNTGEFSWSVPSFCTVAASGIPLQPVFAVGTPILIKDQVPSNSEVVTPTAVSLGGFGCSITVSPVNQHSSFTLQSGTAGLQEAINYASGLPYQIILSPDWTRLGGTTGMITSAKGNYNVSIFDQRTSVLVPYVWNGTAYAATSFGGSACNPNTIPNGCTSATTQLGVSGALGIPLSDNVAGFGAVGDCTPTGSTGSCTDNCTTIQAVINDAATKGIAVYLPPNVNQGSSPTVYYTSCTLSPKGVSIYGPPGGGGTNYYFGGVSIRGAPGKDVFATGDPTSGGYAAAGGGFIWKDFSIIVDDSEDVSSSNTHRKPGKTCSDVTVTNGSPVVASGECEFNQGDVGQNVSVTNGTNTLAATIISVPVTDYDYNTTNTATLSANWTYASQSDATIYVAIMSQSVSQRVGNCALSYDNTSTLTSPGPTLARFENINIDSISGVTGANNDCAFFFQGTQPYGVIWDNLFIHTEWGLLAVSQDGLTASQSSSLAGFGDTNAWKSVFLEAQYPWVTYNGSFNRWEGGQVYSGVSGWGPQILDVAGLESGSAQWDVKNVEYEGPTGSSGGSWRVDGNWHNFVNTELTTANTGPAQWDAASSKCNLCNTLNLNITGQLNEFQFENGIGIVTDTGFGNQCSILRSPIPYDGQQPSLPQSCSAVNSRQAYAFVHDSAFVANGDEQTPYNNQSDLWIWPQDMHDGFGRNIIPSISVDPTSESGVTLATPNTGQWYIVGLSGGKTISIGQANTGANLPATWVHVCGRLKLVSGGPGVYLQLFANSVNVGQVNPSLSSSYGTYCFDANLSSYAGDTAYFNVGAGGTVADLAWISVHPWSNSENITGQMQSASVLGPATAPTGACSVNGQWELTQDGAITKCVSGTWASFSNGGSIPGGVLGSVPYQSGPGVTAVSAANTSASTQCFTETGTGSVGAIPAWGSCAGSAATPFSAITGSTNTSAAMVVGSGATFDFAGTGTIDANLINGAVVPASTGFLASNSSRQIIAAAYTPTNAAVVPSTAPSSGQILVGNTGGTAYAPVTASGSCTVNYAGVFTCSGGSSGLSGMTAGQVPIAATASTVTSSKTLAGSGAAITTGPSSSTSGDAVGFTGTGGQIQDLGYAPAPAVGNVTDETTSWSLVANNVYRFTGSGASNATTPATTAATGLISFVNAGSASATVVTGGPTLVCVPSSCVVPVGASVLVNTDGTDQYAIISNANGSAFGTLANASTINNSNWSGTVLAAGNGGTGVANTATYTLGSSNQNWATLGTGIVKNTTTTGAITDAVAADVYGLWSGTCSSSTFLRGDGACAAPSGSGTVNPGTAFSPAYYGATGTAVSGTTPFSGFEYWAGSSAPAAATQGNLGTLLNLTSGDVVVSGGSGSAPTAGPVAANLVVASSPGAGVAHFAGSTQTVTSSTIATGDIAANAVTLAKLATQGANTVLANVTGSTAVPTAASIPAGVQFYTAGTGYSAATSANLLGVCTTCVTSAASLTNNALMTGAGTQGSQTITTGTGVTTALGVNTGSAGAVGVLVATGTAAMNTSAIASGACATVVTVTATGAATTDVIETGFNGDPTAVTGYGASATGAVLTIYPYPSSGNVNFKVCNSTASSITPGSLTLNWKVYR